MKAKMKFKNYEWPYDPKQLKIEQKKDISELKIPFVGTVLQNLKCSKRVISGNGEFFGPDCFEQYSRLCELYKENDSGYLSITDVGTFLAVFKKLNMSCEPGPKSISYYFEFWEDMETKPQSEALVATYHVVKEGETIFDIARLYNKTVKELLNLNPHIKRVDELKVGDRVMLQ